MAEFSFIDRYCFGLGSKHPDTILSVGDDAAIVSVPEGFELAISVDTMVEGTHFFKGLAPELLAHKILAVNLSDMAAMGARPKWATVAMCLPELDQEWFGAFSDTMNKVANQYGVQIIGGDTTQGPRVLSLTIMGLLPKGAAMTRSGAEAGDKLYCSGNIGDAALALTRLQGEQTLTDDVFDAVLSVLHTPTPQVALGQRLLGYASACLDLSDGLIGDSTHIAKLSDVSIEIDVEKLPLSDAYRRYLSQGGLARYAITGGDDYQLLFTANQEKEAALKAISKDLGVKITEIGRVVSRADKDVVLLEEGNPIDIEFKAYQHFT